MVYNIKCTILSRSTILSPFYHVCHVVTTLAKQLFSRSRRLQNATKWQLKLRMRNMLECRYRSNSGGCLNSLNTASPGWWPFKWDIRFVVLKLFFSFSRDPCWTCIANSNAIVLLCHREKLPDQWRHVHKWWRNERDTSWESLQFKAAVTCTRKVDEFQIDQTDWLIYQQAYFFGSRYRISFIYRSNKNDVIFTHIGR